MYLAGCLALGKGYLHHGHHHYFPPFKAYVFRLVLIQQFWPKRKKTNLKPLLLLVFSAFPSLFRPFIVLFSLSPSYSDVPTKHRLHFIQISPHYCVLKDHLSLFLASGRKRDLTREIILVLCQDFITRKKPAVIRVTRKAHLKGR